LSDFDAREWLRSVSDAVRTLQIERQWVETQRERTLSLGTMFKEVNVSTTPNVDKMGASDALVDYEMDAERGIHAKSEVREALSVFEGMRSVGPMEYVAANVMQMRHVDLMGIADVARQMCVSRATAQRRYDY
jgi:hypothetical protein